MYESPTCAKSKYIAGLLEVMWSFSWTRSRSVSIVSVLKRHNIPSQSYQHFEAVNEMLPRETRRCYLERFYMVRVVSLEACMSRTMLKNEEEWTESDWIQIVGSSGGPLSLGGSA